MTTLIHTFTGHAGAIYTLDFDGRFIYSGAADKFVVRWNLATGEQDKFAIKFDQTPYSIALFDNNSKLAVGLANGDLHFFDIKERKELKFYQQHIKGIFSLLENRSRNHLYVTDADGNLSVWDTKNLELIIYLPFDCGKIRRIVLDKDELLMVCQDGTFRIIDTTTFNEVECISVAKEGATAILPLPDVILIGAKDAHLHLYDPLTRSIFSKIPAHNYVIYDIIQVGEKVVTSSRDKSIKIWDLNINFIQKIERKDKGHQHSVNALVGISETQFASCSDDGKIKIWEIN